MQHFAWYYSDAITVRLRRTDAGVVERLDGTDWIEIPPANGIDERIATDPAIVETDPD